MDPTVRLTDLLGRKVVGPDGRRVGRVADLAVDHAERFPRVSGVVVRHRRALTVAPWSNVLSVEAKGLVLAPGGRRPRADLLLARDVLDAQVVDIAGRRLARVGEIHLGRERDDLRAIAVDVGLGPVLRRLGLRRMSGHAGSEMLAWDRLHFTGARGHAVQLASPAAAVHGLEPAELADLVAHLPPDREAEVLAVVPHERAEHAKRLRRHRPHRRFPMMRARKRAPS